MGRYLRTDPNKGDVFRPNTLIKYSYCSSNPLAYIDEEGLCRSKPFCIPIWRKTSKKVTGHYDETWGKGFQPPRCLYFTRRQDHIERKTETFYLCYYLKEDACTGKCVIDDVKIKKGTSYDDYWSSWYKLKSFTAKPLHWDGIYYDCPAMGPNWSGPANCLP